MSAGTGLATNLGVGPTIALDLTAPDAANGAGRARTKKAPNAFRTISEVADDLNIPQHVLRFWETKFPQVKPLKRGGGRRYYRPDDIQLLRGIADLLYTQCYTIKGVQRLLKDSGGKLGDNIPPASDAERAAAAAEPEVEALALFPDEPAGAPCPPRSGRNRCGWRGRWSCCGACWRSWKRCGRCSGSCVA